MPKYLEIGEEKPQWEWNNGSRWQRMEQNAETQIEAAYQKNPTGTVQVYMNYTYYNISLASMEQENRDSYSKRPIRRILVKTNLKKINIDELSKLFAKYKDSDEEVITGEGIMNFCSDFDINPEDISLMILFWKLGCDTKYTLTETQFINGLAELGMETSSKIKSKMANIKNEISNAKDFKKFYTWCFSYMKDPTQKRIHVDFALPTWKLIMKGRYKYLDDWIKFWENGKEKTIPKDVWTQFLEFTKDTTFTNWKDFDPGAYPIAIEEFVDSMK